MRAGPARWPPASPARRAGDVRDPRRSIIGRRGAGHTASLVWWDVEVVGPAELEMTASTSMRRSASADAGPAIPAPTTMAAVSGAMVILRRAASTGHNPGPVGRSGASTLRSPTSASIRHMACPTYLQGGSHCRATWLPSGSLTLLQSRDYAQRCSGVELSRGGGPRQTP